MEIGNQIRLHRAALGLSQEELAEKLYVSRQSISNWETGKNYPDIHSLLLMSTLFGVSLDELIKGDIAKMKEAIEQDDIRRFARLSRAYSILFALCILAAAPLAWFLRWWGLAIESLLFAGLMVLAFRVEKEKKRYDIRTYKEIGAFLEGKRLDEIQRQQETGKLPYQRAFLAAACGVVALAVTMALTFLLKRFFP